MGLGSHWGDQNEEDSIEALNTAIDKGVNIIDTAAVYGDGKSEQIISKVLKARKERVYVATKNPPLDGPWPPSPYCKIEDRYPNEYIVFPARRSFRDGGADKNLDYNLKEVVRVYV